MLRKIFIILAFLALPSVSLAAVLNVQPNPIIQGDPILISVQEIPATSTAQIYFDNKPLKTFTYKNNPTALYGFDINKKPGVYKVSAKLSNGSSVEKLIVVGERKKAEISFNIPAKLGGNATSSQKTLVSTLAVENAGLLGLGTALYAYWTHGFTFPLLNPIITDPYGYIRQTGATTLTHKGIDFRATEGTRVLAINSGVVKLVQWTRNYGKTIVIDHGLGVQSLYMHLSKIYVNKGDYVDQGQIIGLSGQTGYADSPHLHLSIRINEVSIDPLVFLNLFR